MSDVWLAGDLALCVNDRFNWPQPHGTTRPKSGCVYKVAAVSMELFRSGRPALALHLENGPNNRRTIGGAVCFEPVWNARRFRKIHPLTPEEHRQAIVELAADRRQGAPR